MDNEQLKESLIRQIFSDFTFRRPTVPKLFKDSLEVNYYPEKIEINDMKSGRKFVISIKEITK